MHPIMPATWASSSVHVKQLWVAQGGRGGGKGAMSGYKFASVGSRFKRQLGELMEALQRMEPHYIRCIKPNSRNRSASHTLAHCPAACITLDIVVISETTEISVSAASCTKAVTSQRIPHLHIHCSWSIGRVL